MTDFVVARNPNSASRLPYLVRVPLPGGDLWLKTRETWPRATRVYCHPVDAVPSQMEIVEHVRVIVCKRRGNAIDLVLDRGVNRRSQFVFVTYRGRDLILWQSAKAAKSARPNCRIPYGRSSAQCVFLIDSRERYAYGFPRHDPTTRRQALKAGDYAVASAEVMIAVVERKTIEDFTTTLIDGSLNYELAELANVRLAAVVVEGTYSELLRHKYTRSGLVPTLISRLAIRYPAVPIMFLESRKVAEEWTYQFLRAAFQGRETPRPQSSLPFDL